MAQTKIKVECPHRGDCSDADSEKCQSCINNKKRSYYRHKDYCPTYPIYPYYPNYPDYWTYPYWYIPTITPYRETTTLPLDTTSAVVDASNTYFSYTSSN